jgi:hypothetical protein
MLLLCLMLISSSSLALDSCFTGSWFDPVRDGEGINIEVNDGLVVAYFYTYDRRQEKTWFTLLGDQVLVIMDTFKVVDKYQDFKTQTVLVGSASIEPLTPNAVYFVYQFDLEYKNGIKYECITTDNFSCKGTYLYRRLTQPIPCGK